MKFFKLIVFQPMSLFEDLTYKKFVTCTECLSIGRIGGKAESEATF